MDLQHSAMVIAVVTVTIQTVSSHELDNLKRTFGAVDVGELNVGFEILVKFRRMGGTSRRRGWAAPAGNGWRLKWSGDLAQTAQFSLPGLAGVRRASSQRERSDRIPDERLSREA
jgi:hypothetical protein